MRTVINTSNRILGLPEHLQKTYVAVIKLGLVNADMVAKETRRCRAIESSNLNQLVTLGLLTKMPRSKKIQWFSLLRLCL
jgi:hypothetical protein